MTRSNPVGEQKGEFFYGRGVAIDAMNFMAEAVKEAKEVGEGHMQ